MSYYTRLLGMWEELYLLSPLDADSSEKVMWLRTYQFLMGLDDSFNQIYNQIINIKPLPSLDSAYAMIVQEESHQQVTTHCDDSIVGFYTNHDRKTENLGSSTALTDADRTPSGCPWCTHYNRVGHTHERCYIKHGITPPTRCKGRDKGRGQTAVAASGQPATPSVAVVSGLVAAATQCVPGQSAGGASSPVIPGLNHEKVQRLLNFLDN